MAKVRIGFSTQFELENEKVGIGTDSALATLHATGDIIADGFDLGGGITTVTTYDGFIEKDASISESSIGLDSKSHALSGEIIIEGDVTVSSATTFTSGPENLTVTDNFTLPGISDDKPTLGTIRFNENLGAIQVFVGGPEEPPITGAGGSDSPYFPRWKTVNSYVDMGGSSGRGIIAGGYINPGGGTSNIHYITIPTLGNSVYFGDMTDARGRGSACASSTRGVVATGQYTNHIDYITIASTGDAIEFGDTGNLPAGYRASASSSTRGIWAGGYTPAPTHNINNIDYVEIATTGNGNDFGDLMGPRWHLTGLSSPTRGVFAGGYEAPNVGADKIDADGDGQIDDPFYGNPSRLMDFVTIASLGDAVDFGNLTVNAGMHAGLSNNVRGVWAGGCHPSHKFDIIDYITIASTGNAQYFGDLAVFREAPTASSTHVRGTFGGGRQPAYVNNIEYVTIESAGNANDFGDLSTGNWFNGAGCSNSHGGLGGF